MTPLYVYLYTGALLYIAGAIIMFQGPAKKLLWWMEDRWYEDHGAPFPLIFPSESYVAAFSIFWIVFVPMFAQIWLLDWRKKRLVKRLERVNDKLHRQRTSTTR